MSQFDNPVYRVVLHGGAGVISRENPHALDHFEHLKEIVKGVHQFIEAKHQQGVSISAVDIVEHAINLLENDELFNAGKGGVYADSGLHELEASIMDGSNLKCGAASYITRVRNPISVARKVMEKTPHNYLIGRAAEEVAIREGLEEVDNSYFDTPHRYEQYLAAQKASAIELDDSYKRLAKNGDSNSKDRTGTVGCVAWYNGNIAAGTSTGGMTNKMSGRVGDSPIIGAGTYADNRYCGVSCTGVGEEFMRNVVAYDVTCRIQYGHKNLFEAVEGAFAERIPADTGGLIAIDKNGDCCMRFNTVGMFRGQLDHEGSAKVGIWEEEETFRL
eukprot:gene4118-4409_t